MNDKTDDKRFLRLFGFDEKKEIGRLLKITFTPIVTDCLAYNIGMAKLTINYDSFFFDLPNYLSGYQGPLTG